MCVPMYRLVLVFINFSPFTLNKSLTIMSDNNDDKINTKNVQPTPDLFVYICNIEKKSYLFFWLFKIWPKKIWKICKKKKKKNKFTRWLPNSVQIQLFDPIRFGFQFWIDQLIYFRLKRKEKSPVRFDTNFIPFIFHYVFFHSYIFRNENRLESFHFIINAKVM